MATKWKLVVLFTILTIDITYSRHLSHLRRTQNGNANSINSRSRTNSNGNSRRGNMISQNARPETTGATRSTQSDSRRNSIRNSISAAERQATRPVPKRDVDKTMDGLGSIGNMLPSPINQFIKNLRSSMPNLSVGIGASFGKRGQSREPESQSRRQQNFDRRQDLSERRPRKTMNSINSRSPDPLIDLRDPFPVENRNTRQFIDKVEPRFDNNRNRLPDFTSGFGVDNQNQQSDPWTQSGNFMDRFAPEPTFLLSGGKQPAVPPSTSSMSSPTDSNSLNRITQDQSLNSNRGMLPNNNNQLVASQNVMTNSQGQGNQGVRQSQVVSGQNTMTNNQVQGNQGQLVTGQNTLTNNQGQGNQGVGQGQMVSSQNTMTNNMQMQGMMTNNRNNLLQGQNLINNIPQQSAGSQGQTFNQNVNVQGNTQNMNQMLNQQNQVPVVQNSPVNQMVLQQNQNKLPGMQQQQIQSQSNALTTSLMNGQIQNNMDMSPPVNTILSQGQIQQNSGGQMGTGLNVQNLNQIQGQNTIQSNNQFQQGQIQQQQNQQTNNQNQVQNQQTLLTSLLQQLLVQLNDGQSGSNTINSVPRKTLNLQQNMNQLPNRGQSVSNNPVIGQNVLQSNILQNQQMSVTQNQQQNNQQNTQALIQQLLQQNQQQTQQSLQQQLIQPTLQQQLIQPPLQQQLQQQQLQQQLQQQELQKQLQQQLQQQELQKQLQQQLQQQKLQEKLQQQLQQQKLQEKLQQQLQQQKLQEQLQQQLQQQNLQEKLQQQLQQQKLQQQQQQQQQQQIIQQNNLLLGLNAKNNVQPLQQQQTILNNQQVVRQLPQNAQSQSNSILQALLGMQASSPMTSMSQGQQQSKTNSITPVNNNLIGNTETLQANPVTNNLLKQLGLIGNNLNQLNQGTNLVSNTVTKQQTLPQPPPVSPIQGNQVTINLLKQLGLTSNLELSNLLNQGTQQKQTLSTNQQIQPLIQQTQALSTKQLMQPVNQQMQQSNQQTQAASTNQQTQPLNQQIQQLNQQTQAVSANQQMQPSNQLNQAVSPNQQTQPLNRQMQSLNQQMQPLNQQVQQLNQQIQSVSTNQQMQPSNQLNQAVSTNQQMQPVNQQIQPVNQQIQPVNQQTQPVNQQTQPVNQPMEAVNQQMQSSNQQPPVVSTNQQQIQPVNQQTQVISPNQQMQPSNQQTQAVSSNQQIQLVNQQFLPLNQTVSTNQPNPLEALVSQQLLSQILGQHGLGTMILPTFNPIPPMAAGEIEIAPPITLPTTVSPLSTINKTSQGFDLPLQRLQQDQQLNLATNLPLEVSGNSSLSPAETGVTQAKKSVMQDSTVASTTVTTKDNLVIRLNQTSKGIRLIPDGRGGVRIINLRAAVSTETPWIESGTSNSTVLTDAEPLHRLALLNPTNETLRKLEITDRLNTTDIPEEIELPNGTSLDGPGPTPAMNSVYRGKPTTLTPTSVVTIKPTSPTTIKPAAPTTVEPEETTIPIDFSEYDIEPEEGMSTTSSEVEPTTTSTTIAQNATMRLNNATSTSMGPTSVITVKPTTITTTTATIVTVKPTTIERTTPKPTTINKTTIRPTTIKTITIRPSTLKPPTTQFVPMKTPQTFIQSALGWLSPFSTTPASDIIAYGGFLNMVDPYMQTKAHEPALYDILNEVMLGKLKGMK